MYSFDLLHDSPLSVVQTHRQVVERIVLFHLDGEVEDQFGPGKNLQQKVLVEVLDIHNFLSGQLLERLLFLQHHQESNFALSLDSPETNYILSHLYVVCGDVQGLWLVIEELNEALDTGNYLLSEYFFEIGLEVHLSGSHEKVVINGLVLLLSQRGVNLDLHQFQARVVVDEFLDLHLAVKVLVLRLLKLDLRERLVELLLVGLQHIDLVESLIGGVAVESLFGPDVLIRNGKVLRQETQKVLLLGIEHECVEVNPQNSIQLTRSLGHEGLVERDYFVLLGN